jgi:hypothetical protein
MLAFTHSVETLNALGIRDGEKLPGRRLTPARTANISELKQEGRKVSASALVQSLYWMDLIVRKGQCKKFGSN